MTLPRAPVSKPLLDWSSARSLFDLISGIMRLPEHFAETWLTAIALLGLQIHAPCMHLTFWLDCKLPRGRAKSRQLWHARPVPFTGVVVCVYETHKLLMYFWAARPSMCAWGWGGENKHFFSSHSDKGDGALPATLWLFHAMESLRHSLAYTGEDSCRKRNVTSTPKEAQNGFEEISWPWDSGRSMLLGRKPPHFQSRLYP